MSGGGGAPILRHMPGRRPRIAFRWTAVFRAVEDRLPGHVVHPDRLADHCPECGVQFTTSMTLVWIGAAAATLPGVQGARPPGSSTTW